MSVILLCNYLDRREPVSTTRSSFVFLVYISLSKKWNKSSDKTECSANIQNSQSFTHKLFDAERTSKEFIRNTIRTRMWHDSRKGVRHGMMFMITTITSLQR